MCNYYTKLFIRSISLSMGDMTSHCVVLMLLWYPKEFQPEKKDIMFHFTSIIWILKLFNIQSFTLPRHQDLHINPQTHTHIHSLIHKNKHSFCSVLSTVIILARNYSPWNSVYELLLKIQDKRMIGSLVVVYRSSIRNIIWWIRFYCFTSSHTHPTDDADMDVVIINAALDRAPITFLCSAIYHHLLQIP